MAERKHIELSVVSSHRGGGLGPMRACHLALVVLPGQWAELQARYRCIGEFLHMHEQLLEQHKPAA